MSPALNHQITNTSSLSAGVTAVAFDGASEEWDGMLAGFDDSTLEQTAAYARRAWGKRAKFYMVRDDQAPIGGAVVLEVAPPALKTGLSYLKFGPFWRPKNVAVDRADYERVIGAIQHQICRVEQRCLAIVPRPNPEFYDLEADVLDQFGFAVRDPSVDPNRYLVNLALDKEAQSKSLDQKWRYNLRRAGKAGVTVERDDGEAGFAAFDRMHRDMRARKAYGSLERVDIVPELMATLPYTLRPKIYIARHEEQPVAGAVICNIGDMAHYVFGATSSNAMELRAGYALQWHIIQDISNTTPARWYDLGGEAGSSGLRQFKKGLTGRNGKILHTAGQYVYCESPLASAIASMVFLARSARRVVRHKGI